MSRIKVKKIGIVFCLVLLVNFACVYPRNSASITQAIPCPKPSSELMIDGIYRISDLSDVKVFQIYLLAEEEYTTVLCLDTIGTASLQLTVTSMVGPVAGFPITIYNQVLDHDAELEDVLRSFVIPDEGLYEFRLGLSENPWNGNATIPPYLIAVRFALKDEGALSNSRTREAGEAGTPLIDARWYIGDDKTPAYWDYDLPLTSNSTYYVCTCFAFLLNGTGSLPTSVLISAILYPPEEEVFYPIICEGILNDSVLMWHTVWFGTPEGGTHVLRVRIDAAATFRACIAITVSRHKIYVPDPPTEDDIEWWNLSGDNLTFTIGTVGIIAVAGCLMVMTSKHRKKQVHAGGGSVRRDPGRGGY